MVMRQKADHEDDTNLGEAVAQPCHHCSAPQEHLLASVETSETQRTINMVLGG